jgi:hypothetical protein
VIETAPDPIEPRFLSEAVTLLFPSVRYSPADVAEMEPASRAQVERVARALADHNAERLQLQKFARMVSDLDRNEHGRHEGDADAGDPSGASQGNPLLRTGDTLGYGLGGGIRYVMPERGRRHDPDAWIVR